MLDRNRHRSILLRILKEIFTDTSFGPLLGFKGGTAAHFFYDLGRFSLDLDFDLLDETQEDYVFERVKQIVNDFGKIKESRKKRFSLFLLLSYQKDAPNIKIEMNRRMSGSRYELKSYLGISMLVMVREDMFAHKLVAMFERMGRANRDIFDVWCFLKNSWPINKEIVEKRTGTAFKDFLGKCIDLLEKMPDRGILAGMGELLDEKQKAWAKANLRRDAIFLLEVMREHEK